MLYSESWQSGKKDSGALITALLAAFLLLLTGCNDASHPFKHELSLDAFSELKTDEYALNALLIKENLEHISHADHDKTYATTQIKNYYQQGGGMVWVGYQMVDERADTLLAVLESRLPAIGFSQQPFNLSQIREDLERIRSLQFDEANNINLVLARLEYNLSKAYLRYAAGQRFGFVNPTYVLNHLELRENDSTRRYPLYRQLYDVRIERPANQYLQEALTHAMRDSLGTYLRQVEPTSGLYSRLSQMLLDADSSQRQRILVNMERCRWRDSLKITPTEKHVIVNVPAFHLWAVAPDSIVEMRVVCGNVKTKTPLLSSQINYMEVNPEWVIPVSIIRNEVAPHGGDSAYFARNRYYIADRETGVRLSPSSVTPKMLRSGNYRVAQEGGAGNSLGRIVFRFPNNFSVFLHDTSSPGAFGRDNRGVSHGCVRVQRPFDLAVFMMEKDPDPKLLDKLRISMGMRPETDWGRNQLDRLDPEEEYPTLVRSISVSPRVPIIITYYTIFQTPDGSIQYYPDVYGYDKAIAEALKSYIR